jgi:hypothetical protein
MIVAIKIHLLSLVPGKMILACPLGLKGREDYF